MNYRQVREFGKCSDENAHQGLRNGSQNTVHLRTMEVAVILPVYLWEKSNRKGCRKLNKNGAVLTAPPFST
jgi:hypothetical protein